MKKFLSDLAGLIAPPNDPAAAGPQEAFLPVKSLPEAVRRVRAAGYFPEDLTVCDVSEGLLLAYHFCLYEPSERLTLFTLARREDPILPSVSAIFPGMNWHEREAAEMYGLRFSGHPQLKPLLLDEENSKNPPLLKGAGARRPLAAIGLGWLCPAGPRHEEKTIS